ncbi:HU family DNA-binding protein [Pelagibacteraceae bacterium]|nr:HU family DNA-binding protein [Pelagibacteraceae bacterium]
MSKINKFNLTKKEISIKVNQNIGISSLYASEIINDLISILMSLIKIDDVNIKNFGTFKTKNKKERLGRNPKNNKSHIIKARKSLSFTTSKKLNAAVNKN